MLNRYTEKDSPSQLDDIPTKKKTRHSAADQPHMSRSSGAVSRSRSRSSSGSRSPPRRTHSAGHRRKFTEDPSAFLGKYESKFPQTPEKPKSGRKRQVSPPEEVVEVAPARPEKRRRRFLEEKPVAKVRRTPPPRDDVRRGHVMSPPQRQPPVEPAQSSRSRTVAESLPTKPRRHQRNMTQTQPPGKSRKRYTEEVEEEESSSDDEDSSSSGSSSTSSSGSSSSSSSDDSPDSEEEPEEIVKPKPRRHVKSRKSHPAPQPSDSHTVKKKRSTKERYSPVDDGRRSSKQRPRGERVEHRSKGRKHSPPLLPPLEDRQRHWDRENVDDGRARSRKHGSRNRRAASPPPVDAMPSRSRQKSPTYDHQRERHSQHGRDEFDAHYPAEKTRNRGDKWEQQGSQSNDSPMMRSRSGDNRDRYARPPEFERRTPPSELSRRPLSPQEYGNMGKARRSPSPDDRRQYKDDRGRPMRERDRERERLPPPPREESPPRLPHQAVDRYGKRYGPYEEQRDCYRRPLLPTPKDRYHYEQELGPPPQLQPPQQLPPPMLDRYGREPYLLPLPPGGRDIGERCPIFIIFNYKINQC